MKKIKVTVTGLFNETFTGTDEEVESYLLSLKRKQDALVDREQMEMYRYETQYDKILNNENAHEHRQIKKNYPTLERERFQQSNVHLGLKISIKSFIEQENEFF